MRKIFQSLMIISIIFLFYSIGPGQEAAPLKVGDLASEAVAHNPSIEAARLSSQSAEHMVRPAGALPDPMIILGIMNLPVDTFAFDQEAMTQKLIGVTQRFPFPGKLKLSEAVADSDAQAARLQIRVFEERLKYEVKRTFFLWAYAVEALRVTRVNMDIIDSFAKIATSNYSVGKGSQWDILSAQVQHSKLDERARTAEQNIESFKAMMAALLGTEAQKVDGRPQVEWTPVIELDEQALLKRADENNPSLAYMKMLVEKSDNAVRLARRQKYPNFSVTLSYGQRSDSNVNGTTVDRPDFLSATVGIEVPLYARRKQAPMTLAAQSSAQSMRSRLEDERLRIHADVSDRILRIRRADEVEKLYRTGIIPQAETTVQSAIAAYQVGKVDFLALLTSELNLMNHQLDYYMVRINREIDLAALEMLIGEPLK